LENVGENMEWWGYCFNLVFVIIFYNGKKHVKFVKFLNYIFFNNLISIVHIVYMFITFNMFYDFFYSRIRKLYIYIYNMHTY